MKKFVLKASIFVCGLVFIILVFIWIPSKSEAVNQFIGKITNSSEFSREANNGGPMEIIPKIELAQEKSQHTKLVLGDSVCFRLFRGLQESNDEYLLLGTNQAIGMTGQYLLAEQFIKNHEDVTDIYVIMINGSLDSDFGTQWGYQYAVMPFVEKGLFYNLDEESIKAAEDTYGKVFLNENVVNIIDYSDVNRKLYLNILNKYGKSPVSTGEYTSDIVMTNLKRLKQLCDDNNINLHVLPGPMPDTEERKRVLEEQKKEFETNGLGEVMKLYFECVTLYPEEYFPDGYHPGGEYGTREKLNEMIANLQKKSGLLEGVVLKEE